MAESQLHRNYVASIVEWIHTRRNPNSNLIILTDDGTGRPQSKPQKINGYFPDVFAKAPGSSEVIIGEAKTANDLERPHTERQIAAFLTYIEVVGGGTLVVAVPWFRAVSARELINDHMTSILTTACEVVIVEQLE